MHDQVGRMAAWARITPWAHTTHSLTIIYHHGAHHTVGTHQSCTQSSHAHTTQSSHAHSLVMADGHLPRSGHQLVINWLSTRDGGSGKDPVLLLDPRKLTGSGSDPDPVLTMLKARGSGIFHRIPDPNRIPPDPFLTTLWGGPD